MINDYIQSTMVKDHIPGLSVAVVQNGEPILIRGYGLANIEHSVAATEQTVYEIASVGKTFTATVTMMLVEEGSISLGGLPRQSARRMASCDLEAYSVSPIWDS